MKYADYIKQIEIDALWSGKKHILWTLDPHVNVLSGINGVGKSTILNKVFRSVNTNGDIINHLLKGVHITAEPEDATHVRFDIIRSLDSPVFEVRGEKGEARDYYQQQNFPLTSHLSPLTSMLDVQLYHLQRKYLDYQVNIGNRIIAELQRGNTNAAQELSQAKTRFQDIVDDLFAETGKKIVRTENEIRFSQIGETLVPYQLSSGEKQMLAILLTVLVEDQQHYVLFMDEPEVSLHIEWQKRLIDLIMELNPNVQIILTTHSPAVIMNGWMENVTEVSDITL
ncbi:MAG: ATP-binding protein [Prevotella sp.]|nr:ATP-binding protein [Prevotella sp.]